MALKHESEPRGALTNTRQLPTGLFFITGIYLYNYRVILIMATSKVLGKYLHKPITPSIIKALNAMKLYPVAREGDDKKIIIDIIDLDYLSCSFGMHYDDYDILTARKDGGKFAGYFYKAAY